MKITFGLFALVIIAGLVVGAVTVPFDGPAEKSCAEAGCGDPVTSDVGVWPCGMNGCGDEFYTCEATLHSTDPPNSYCYCLESYNNEVVRSCLHCEDEGDECNPTDPGPNALHCTFTLDATDFSDASCNCE